MQLGLGDVTGQCHDAPFELWRGYTPDCRLTIRQCEGLDPQSTLAPSLVCQHIFPSAIAIGSPAVLRLLQGIDHAIHLEDKADIAMMPLLHHSKDRTVGSLQPPVCMTAIEGTGIAVLTILTSKAAVVRHILLTTLDTNLVEVIGY